MKENSIKHNIFKFFLEKYRKKHHLDQDFFQLNLLKASKNFKSDFSFQNYFHGTKNQEVVVSSVVSVTFAKSNTRVSFFSSCGSLLFSCSSGSVGLKGKQKLDRKTAVRKILFRLSEAIKKDRRKFNPVALHTKNVGRGLAFLLKTVSLFFGVSSIKSYDNSPYNGCRKKKLRRKKLAKQIRR